MLKPHGLLCGFMTLWIALRLASSLMVRPQGLPLRLRIQVSDCVVVSEQRRSQELPDPNLFYFSMPFDIPFSRDRWCSAKEQDMPRPRISFCICDARSHGRFNGFQCIVVIKCKLLAPAQRRWLQSDESVILVACGVAQTRCSESLPFVLCVAAQARASQPTDASITWTTACA